MRREKSNYIIQSVSHALDVLEQFFGESDELGVTELSKRLKLHKNNVFRLLATLESRGYIEQNRATENYRLGIRCLQLGQSYVQHMGLLRQARPIMIDLVRQAHETTYLAVLRRGFIVPVEVIEADRAVRILPPLGEALPLHSTAAGKAWTAASFRTDTSALMAISQPGMPQAGLRNLPGAVILGGGMIIEGAGSMVGAIGVSGAPGGDADDACAKAGIDAIRDRLDF